MAQFTSYNQVGLKEDVSDIITDITPCHPSVFHVRSRKANARVNWMEDPDRSNQQPTRKAEGSTTISIATPSGPKRTLPHQG